MFKEQLGRWELKMGKVKQIIMGDEKAEEEARKKAKAKREAKKVVKKEEPKKEEKIAASPAERGSRNDKNTRGKKYTKVVSLVDKKKTYSIKDALDLVKKTSFSKFDGTVEVIFNVSDKGLRGTVSLPHGTGNQIRVKIADDALVANPIIDFDILVAHPSMMPKLAKIAKILGPKGLMPNPKTNTIGNNPEELALSLSKGQINYKTEPDFPIIHSIIGKVSFEDKKLTENLEILVKSIGKDKIKSAFLKPTMGVSVKIQV